MAGEVEEAEQVVVADVEEEVAGARVVPVLHQLDQREAEELLVEPDRLLDVRADQRQVVHAADGAGRAVAPVAAGTARAVPPGEPAPARVPRPVAVAWLPPCAALRDLLPAQCRLPGPGAARLPALRRVQPRVVGGQRPVPERPAAEAPVAAVASSAGGTAVTGQLACAKQNRGHPAADSPGPRARAVRCRRRACRRARWRPPGASGPASPRSTAGCSDDVYGRAAEGQLDGLRQPRGRRRAPGLPQAGGRVAPVGQLAARRHPGQHGHQRGAVRSGPHRPRSVAPAGCPAIRSLP